jgi:hypothetical protein
MFARRPGHLSLLNQHKLTTRLFSLEQLLRFEAKPLFGNFSLKQSSLLANIVKQASFYGITRSIESVRKSCVRLLASILPYKVAVFDAKNILEIDMFHLLVSLCLSMPNLYEQARLSSVANATLNDSNIFKLVLQACCVQILLTKINQNSFGSNSNIKDDPDAMMLTTESTDSATAAVVVKNNEEDVEIIFEFYTHLLNLVSEKSGLKWDTTSQQKVSKRCVYASLSAGLMPFLRCSALFFSQLTGLVPSTTITCWLILPVF